MAGNKGLILLGTIGVGAYLLRDQLFSGMPQAGPGGTNAGGTVGQGTTQGPSTGTQATNGTTGTAIQPDASLRAYLEQVAATDPHIQGNATDKFYWWFWLKKFYGIPGEPPLPLEITYYSDTELIPLETIVQRMSGFQTGIYGGAA